MNSRLRGCLSDLVSATGRRLMLAKPEYCADNAAMVAAAGAARIGFGDVAGADLSVAPSDPLESVR